VRPIAGSADGSPRCVLWQHPPMALVEPALGPSPSLYSVAFDLGTVGFAAVEHFVAGDATRYRMTTDRTPDGAWDVTPVDSAPFRTRIVVHRPTDPARANGTVVVEWLNVTGGFDIPAVWMATHRHLVRSGTTWVGISVQEVGIRGGGGVTSGLSLRETSPERYGSLDHPGDAYAYDIFSQVGRAVLGVLAADHGLGVERVLAAGASQSAMYLTTYVNAVDRHAEVYDGFLLQGRAGAGVPIDGWDPGSIRLRDDDDPGIRVARLAGRDRIRDDARVPVLVVQSETDVFGSLASLGARQDDGDRFRLWEVAGAAHCDTYFLHAAPHDDGRRSVEELAGMIARTELAGAVDAAPMNCGPQMHYVMQRAVDALDAWVRDGTPPPRAERFATDPSGMPDVDELGIVRGGVRTPWVDAPVMVLSGLGQRGVLTELMGTSRPLEPGALAARWPGGRREYVAGFRDATTEAVANGHLLADDADEITALGALAWPAP